jgi:hypothetical protein
MKKIRVFSLFLISAGITLLALVFILRANTSADAPASPQSISGMENMTLEPSKDAPMPANATRAPVQPQQNAVSRDELLTQVNHYRQKAQDQFALSQPGWFHSAWTVDAAVSGGSMPNGEPIPAQYTSESWYYVDEKGMVIRVITLMKTPEGKVFQAAVIDGGQARNSAFSEVTDNEPYPLTDLLHSGYDEITANADLIPAALREYAGRVEISFVEAYQQPLKLVGIDQEVIQTEIRFTIDPNTGLVSKREVFSTFVDGTQRITMSNAGSPLTAVAQPTDEALAWFEELRIK